MSKKIEMINKIFNNFLVLEEDSIRQNKKIYYKCQCLKCNYIFSANGYHIRKEHVRCPNCGWSNKMKDISNKRFGKLIAIRPTPKRYYQSVVWLCKCDCGNYKEVPQKSLYSQGTQSCGCLIESIGERNIKQILNKNNIKYIQQYAFLEDQRKKFDFAILNDNQQVIRLIEFDGKQHFLQDSYTWFKQDSLQLRQQRDKIKNQYAKNHNIPLVRIPYWERNNITLKKILGEQYEI